jgi:hypothetical protein
MLDRSSTAEAYVTATYNAASVLIPSGMPTPEPGPRVSERVMPTASKQSIQAGLFLPTAQHDAVTE